MESSRNIKWLIDKLTPYQISQALDISIESAQSIVEGSQSLEDMDQDVKEKLLDLNNKLLS